MERSASAIDTAIQTDDSFSHEETDSISSSSISGKSVDSTEDLLSPCSSTTTNKENSCSSSSAGSSNTSTRRNSLTYSSSDLGTPLQFLFRSSSSSISAGSQIDSPVGISPDADVLNGLDRLLNRITSERFLELRRIQLGERPVTNGNARTSLENFFQRAINGPSVEQRNAEEEANRPENVANDVQSLIQLSRVQSALQNGFSNRLESVLGYNSQQNTRAPTQLPQTRATTRTPTRPQQGRTTNPPPIAPVRREPITSHGIPAPPPMAPPIQPPQQSVLQNTVDVSVELLAESISTDITRLQSLQVVSNILRTDFRSELETLIQNRVPENGVAVAEFIQTLPRTQRPPHPIQRTASSSLFNHSSSTAHLSDEVHQLRQQLHEMKRMMAMTMEIQMDTQRAIRQEVAAIFTTFMQDYLLPSRAGQTPSHQPTVVHPRTSQVIQAGQCVICCERNVDTVLYHCGHMCVCNQCGLQLKMDGHKCPMCRAPIRDVIRAYQSQDQEKK